MTGRAGVCGGRCLTRRGLVRAAGPVAGLAVPGACRGRMDRPGEAGGGAGGGRPVATPGRATVDFFTNQAPAPFAAVEAALAAFRQQYPQIEVRVTNTPSGYQDKLQTLIVAGATPDLFRAGGDEFARFYVLGSMAVLDGLLARDRFELADFYPASLEQYRWGGRQYGLPSDYGYRMIFYHVDLFQRAGLPLPPGTWEASGWTFDDFGRAARVLTVREPGAPVQWGFLNPRESWQVLVYANGGRVIGPTHDEVWLTRPEAVEALHFAQELEVSHRTGLDREEAAQLPALQTFLAGRGAMLQSSTATGTTSARTISGFTWDVAPPPRGPQLSGGRRTFGGGSGWFLGASRERGSAALEAAWVLLRFLLSRETVSALAAAGFAPPRRSVIHSPVWLDPAQPPRSKGVLTDGFGGIVPFPKLTTWGEWLAIATRELAALWNGTRAAADVAAAIAAATAPALARHRELVGASPP
jgi:multiple sugar transport system substrate-binding protein